MPLCTEEARAVLEHWDHKDSLCSLWLPKTIAPVSEPGSYGSSRRRDLMDSCEVPESRDQAGLKGKEEALGWASWDNTAVVLGVLGHLPDSRLGLADEFLAHMSGTGRSAAG